ncbi:hypothetical protein TNCV_2958731 [Trichonephila clavipes]|nr:hypothetical protein TNCV_2958731 [Trichonephila clavipes]
MKDSEEQLPQQQMSVCKAGMTNAKASQFDIGPSHWHHRPCSYDRFQSAVCYPTADSMIPARSYKARHPASYFLTDSGTASGRWVITDLSACSLPMIPA